MPPELRRRREPENEQRAPVRRPVVARVEVDDPRLELQRLTLQNAFDQVAQIPGMEVEIIELDPRIVGNTPVHEMPPHLANRLKLVDQWAKTILTVLPPLVAALPELHNQAHLDSELRDKRTRGTEARAHETCRSTLATRCTFTVRDEDPRLSWSPTFLIHTLCGYYLGREGHDDFTVQQLQSIKNWSDTSVSSLQATARRIQGVSPSTSSALVSLSI